MLGAWIFSGLSRRSFPAKADVWFLEFGVFAAPPFGQRLDFFPRSDTQSFSSLSA
jgi:hypothetical protein